MLNSGAITFINNLPNLNAILIEPTVKNKIPVVYSNSLVIPGS